MRVVDRLRSIDLYRSAEDGLFDLSAEVVPTPTPPIPGTVELDQSFEKIRQHARKHGRACGRTQPCHGSTSDQGADDHAVRMHDTGPVGREIEGGEGQGTADLGENATDQVLQHLPHKKIPQFFSLMAWRDYAHRHVTEMVDQVVVIPDPDSHLGAFGDYCLELARMCTNR